jgi:hypothetical protein
MERHFGVSHLERTLPNFAYVNENIRISHLKCCISSFSIRGGNKQGRAGSEILTAVSMKRTVFWVVTPCRSEVPAAWFCCFLTWFTLRPWRCRRYFPPKCWDHNSDDHNLQRYKIFLSKRKLYNNIITHLGVCVTYRRVSDWLRNLYKCYYT